MKTFLTSTTMMLLLVFVMVLTGCNKRTNTPCSTVRYQEYSRQLESMRPMHYPVEATLEKDRINDAEKSIVVAEEKSIPTQHTTAIKKNVVADQPKNIVSAEKENKSVKNNLVNKILIKKLEKNFRKQNTTAPQEATGGLRTGIILGAVGLLLLITAGFFGPASPIIYVSGAVLFIVGVVLILVSVL
jgi:hypothetical protein